MSTRENGKAVKMEFWVTQKEQEDRHIAMSKVGLNSLPSKELVISEKVKAKGKSPPMSPNTRSQNKITSEVRI